MADRLWEMSWSFQYTSFRTTRRGERDTEQKHLQGPELSPAISNNKLLLCESDFTLLRS